MGKGGGCFASKEAAEEKNAALPHTPIPAPATAQPPAVPPPLLQVVEPPALAPVPAPASAPVSVPASAVAEPVTIPPPVSKLDAPAVLDPAASSEIEKVVREEEKATPVAAVEDPAVSVSHVVPDVASKQLRPPIPIQTHSLKVSSYDGRF